MASVKQAPRVCLYVSYYFYKDKYFQDYLCLFSPEFLSLSVICLSRAPPRHIGLYYMGGAGYLIYPAGRPVVISVGVMEFRGLSLY